jgi:integrase
MLSASPLNQTKQKFTFQEYYDKFINEHKTGDGYSKKQTTIRKYNSFYSHLKDFAEKNRISLHITNIDLTFLSNFKDYLVNDKKLSDNTVSKYIKAAKTFIRFYINNGLIRAFALNEVKCGEKEGEIYIISIRQLVKLQNYKIQDKRLSDCRDVFCFQCWTGQRYSDVAAIRKEDIKTNNDGQKVWDFFTIKTGDNIKVPIVEYADQILKKHQNNERILPVISLQRQNDNLKELGKLVSINTKGQNKIEGFDSKTKVTEFHDGVRKEEYLPFYEVLTTHVARKSYITNSLIIGVPERVVKEVSGHKSEQDFRRYVNLASSYKDEMIRKSYNSENIEKYI